MFIRVDEQGVRSSKGFEVQFTGRFTMEYREGGKVLVLEIEGGSWGGGPSIGLTKHSDLDRWGKFGPLIGEAEQACIKGNIKEALAFMGLALEPR